jgi:hypothetical protein
VVGGEARAALDAYASIPAADAPVG